MKKVMSIKPAHPAAKKAMKEHGYEYKQGNIITYVITRKGTSISDKARILGDVPAGDYDQEYYISNQVIPAVLRILESLGYTEQELKGNRKTNEDGGLLNPFDGNYSFPSTCQLSWQLMGKQMRIGE